VRALLLEYRAVALNEYSPLYGEQSLAARLAEDVRNAPVLAAFRAALADGPSTVYQVRRVYKAARTPDCRQVHGARCSRPAWWCRHPRTPVCRQDHGEGVPWCEGAAECRQPVGKGNAWRAVNAYGYGSRGFCEGAIRLLAQEPDVVAVPGPRSGIVRAVYLDQAAGYPRAEGFLVAAPAGIRDKQRSGFEQLWTQVTGRQGHWSPGMCEDRLYRQHIII
jgi:hypothetical protein